MTNKVLSNSVWDKMMLDMVNHSYQPKLIVSKTSKDKLLEMANQKQIAWMKANMLTHEPEEQDEPALWEQL